MTLTPISALESAKTKFFMNSTYIMSRKWESKVFGLSRPNVLYYKRNIKHFCRIDIKLYQHS